MEDVAKSLFTTYGPLGLGWVFAVAMYVDGRATRKRLEDLTEKGTAAMVELTTFVRARLGGDHK